MSYIATFDIGTTAVKGVLMSAEGNNIMEKSLVIETFFQGDHKEQRPLDWYAAFCQISASFFQQGILPSEILGIAMSGQMQDLIPVTEDLLPSGNAILYSDGRAGDEAQRIIAQLGKTHIEESTGNHLDGSLPFAKLLWLKEKEPARYEAAHKVLISAKDYMIARLTGAFVTDVTSASTAGLMDIHEKRWNLTWMAAMGLDGDKLPKLCYAEDIVGTVGENAAQESGFAVGTPVCAGTGDAGATTLASGIALDGELNINLGTSGWIACVSAHILKRPQVFNLAAMQKGTYINVVPFLNAGNVHRWICGILASDDPARNQYEQTDQLLCESVAGSNGVMFLPYLVGERFPVMDTAIKGSYVGITAETTKADLARSALEGVAFSIKQGLETIGRSPQKISLIGGGAQVNVWCQILADVLGHQIDVYSGTEFLPAAATAGAILIAQGKIPNYAAYIDSLLLAVKTTCYLPNAEKVNLYQQHYQRYLQIYPALKSISSF